VLRAYCERPCGSRAADERDEVAPPHSITSSARASNGKGTMMPSAFAVLRFIISNFRWPLLTTARLSSFRLLDADRVDYGSATKTGI
jgi:hypothetical protein